MGAAILRAVGDSKRPLYYLIVCSVVNIILDLLLILVIPLGVLGAAIATLIAQAVSAVLVTVTLMYRTEGMKLCLSQIRMYKRMLQSILKIGLPAGFEAIMYSISNIIVQVSINNFGVDTMAAWTAYSKIVFFLDDQQRIRNLCYDICRTKLWSRKMGPHPERYKNLSWHGTDIGGFCEYHLNVCRKDFCLESLSMMRAW